MNAAAFATVLLLASSSTAFPANPADQIRRLEGELARAVVANDAESRRRIEAEGYVYTDSDGKTSGREDFIRASQTGTAVPSLTFDDLVVDTYGDAAVVRGVQTVERLKDGVSIRRVARYTRFYVRFAEGWRAVAAHASAIAAPEGKERTGRAIVVETVVEASPAEVFRLWTTEDGVRSFFARDTHVEARAGGRYEMIFNPAGDPEGAQAGTKGARILRYEPGRRLDFEWSVGVPSVSIDLKSADFATWVEVTFEPVAGRPDATRVRLVHEGFRTGGSWDAAYPFFQKSWRDVLDRLTAYVATGRKPW